MSTVDDSIRVLLIDEDEDYLDVAKQTFDKSEFEVKTTPNPIEALQIIGNVPIDAVVSYYQMTQVNVLDLLQMVRDKHSDLTFIVLTGNSRENVAIEALNMGADFYLQKGYDDLQITELTNVVRQTVKRRRIEKALRDSETRYRLILDSSPVAISVNVEGKIVYANQKRAELTGHQSPQELIGQYSLQTAHPDNLEVIRERQRARIQGERLEPNFSFKAITKQGETIDIKANSTEIMWGGEPALLFSSWDVTDEVRVQRQLVESRQRLQALYNQTVIINKQETYDEVILAVYDALTKCLGYDVIDILKVEEELLRSIYPKKEDFAIPIRGSGITARAARTGETQFVSDTSLDPDYMIGFQGPAMRSEMTVPVKVEGKVAYLLNLESEKPGVFTEEDRNFVEILALHTSSTLEGLRNREKRRAYTRRLEALHHYGLSVGKVDSEDQVAKLTIDALQSVLEFKMCSFSVVEGDQLNFIYKSMPGTIGSLPLSGSDIIVRAVKTGQTQYVPDVWYDPSYVQTGTYYVLSELSVPIMVEGKVQAVIDVENEIANAFSDEDRALVELIAQHASSAFERLLSNERQQVYAKRLEALYAVTEAITSTSTIDEIAELVGTAVKEIIGYDLGSLSIVEEGALHHRYVWGVTLDKEFVIPLDGPGVTVRAVRTGETQLVRDTARDKGFVDPEEVDGIRSELCVPVKVAGEVVAVINAESRNVDAFGEEEHKLLSILAEHVGSTIHNIQFHERELGFTERLEALYRSSTRLAVAGTREEIYDIALDIMREDLKYTWAGVGRVEDSHLRYVRFTGGTLDGEGIVPLDGPGVTVRAVNTGSTQLVKDTRLDPGYVVLEGYEGPYLSELAIPVTVDDRVMLVLNLESSQVDDFNENDVRLMELLARHLASALQNIRSTEERSHYEERLKALSWAMVSMSMVESLEQLADQTLAIIEEIIAAPYSMFMLVEGDNLITVQTRGVPLLSVRLPINGKSVTARAAREKKPILVRDTRLDPGFVKASIDSLSELAVPVIADDKVVGVLNMESLDAGYFNTSHVSLAEALSAHAASNLERLWRDQQMLEAQRRVIEERERAEQAERLQEMKTNFIRTATHEIRTPLTSIKGYAELAQAEIDPDASPSLAKYFTVMLRNTERLEKLTSDLLDVQRIESGRIELNKEPLQVRKLLSEVVEELEPILMKRGQSLTVSGEDARVTADRTRLTQVLINLVVNASRFSPDGSEILIDVKREGDEARVSVIDEGLGISEEDMPKLFTPFPGIHVEGASGGMGLGLSICKGIVELHGGRIWAEHEGSGKGLKFIFTLPKLESGVDV